MSEGYYVEWNGDCWQSVFPSAAADKSQLHVTVDEALVYMVDECGVPESNIVTLNRLQG